MSKEVRVILLVEDDGADACLFSEAIKSARIGSSLITLEDGRSAIAYLGGEGEFSDRVKFPVPDLIFVDLQLPKRSGFEVLSWIRENPRQPPWLVSVLTSQSSEASTLRADLLGAHHYAAKPPTKELFQVLSAKFDLQWPRKGSHP